jgi:hypothetical protein
MGEVRADLEKLMSKFVEEEEKIKRWPMSPGFLDEKDKEDIFVENDVLIAMKSFENEKEEEIENESEIYVREQESKKEIEGEIEEGPSAFEDNPMPILKGFVNVSEKRRKVKILVDSGAVVNLISRELAEEFLKAGMRTIKEGSMRVKLANGQRERINETLRLPIKIGGRWSDAATFFILKNLPFDIVIGDPCLEEWKGTLSWETKIFSFYPNKDSRDKIRVNWKNFVGQHWRKPISLIASEEIILKPYSQTIVLVRDEDKDWEGILGECGLITPNRSEQILNCKFSTAYGIANERTNKVVIANTTQNPIKIKKNSQVAEFHPRERDAFKILQLGDRNAYEKERDEKNREGEKKSCVEGVEPRHWALEGCVGA